MTDIAALAKLVPHLTEMRLEVLTGVAKGLKNPEIAEEFGWDIMRVNNMIAEIYRYLGISKISSRKEKRRLATEAFKLYEAGTITLGDTAADTLASAASLANGEDKDHRNGDLLEPADEIPHSPTAGYGLANTIRIHDPATVIGLRTITLGPAVEAEFEELLRQGYVAEQIVEYQSLSDLHVFVARAIFVKRKRQS